MYSGRKVMHPDILGNGEIESLASGLNTSGEMFTFNQF